MKILLIDDHALFRDGLALLMTQGMASPTPEPVQVLEAGDLDEARRVLHSHPDVILALLDLGLPGLGGLETLLQWRAMAPGVPVVVLSGDDHPDLILQTVDAGAAGFIPKTAQSQTMRHALSVVLDGGVFLPTLPAVSGQTGARDAVPDLGLSERQMDVLRLLVEGKVNKEICRQLDLSESTVKTHLSAIFRKLDVNSRTQAVVAVAQAGWRLRAR